MDRREIEAALVGVPNARLRAKQIAAWIYERAARSFDEMTDLPTALREDLQARFLVCPLEVSRHVRSSDGVDKLLVHSGDDQVFECVLLPYEKRVSCCLSSQIGCPMGCTFCATGLGGFDRNLSAGEIVGQYLLLQSEIAGGGTSVRGVNGEDGKDGRDGKDCLRNDPHNPLPSGPLTVNRQPPTPDLRPATRDLPPSPRISHVVFMGMGEPLLNLPNVLKAIRLLHDEVGLSYRHITVSTVGIEPKIRELAELNLPIHLALSLHSPLDGVRDRLMPVNKRWPVAEVMAALKDYMRATGRKITIEYLLISGVTDTPDQARALARLIKGVPSVVNLIPFNYVDTEQGFSRPSNNRVRAFRSALEAEGVNVTQRVERGHDIAAACGQLAGEHVGRFARRASRTELLKLA